MAIWHESMNIEFLVDVPRLADPECAKLEDKDFFFPTSNVELQQRLPILKGLCAQCAHVVECREYALNKEINEGFWGGMTSEERRKIIHTKKEREDRRSEAIREVQELLDLGYTKEQTATKLGIQVSSLERRLARAKKRGIL